MINDPKIFKKWFTASIIPIVLFYLCEFRFFYLISLPAVLVAGSTNKNLLAVFSVCAFAWFLIREKKLKFGYFGISFILVFVSVTISTILSSFEFGYKLTQVIWGILPYLLLLLYFPAKRYLADKTTMEQFIVIGEIASIFVSILFFIQYAKYTGKPSVFLKIPDLIPDHYIWHPEEGLRIRNTFDGFFRVFSLVIFDRIIAKKFRKSLLDIISYATILAVILLIDRSRAYLVIVLVSSIAILIYRSRKRITTVIFLVGSLALMGGAAVAFIKLTSIAESVLNNSGSWFARVEAAGHYMGVGFEHIFFGIGMADPESYPAVEKYVRGLQGLYYPDDVGLFGLFALLGIIGIALYIVIMIKVCRSFKYATDNKALLFGLMICLILSSVLTSYFDKARLMALVFTAVLCEINTDPRLSKYEFNRFNRL